MQEAVKVIQRNTKRYFALKRLQEECDVKLKSDTSAEDDNETFPEHNSGPQDNAPLNFPPSTLQRSFSPAETTSRQFGFLSTAGSWSDPLETKPKTFTPQSYFAAPCARQMALELNRRHKRPLAMLVCNFSPAQPRVVDAEKLSLTMLSVNKSSTIISRRDIEKVTYWYGSFFAVTEQCLGFYKESIPSVYLWKIGWGRAGVAGM